MYQECVLPLALAYQLEHPKNPFFQEERLREWVVAGIDFARRASHWQGGCDDYFPYERACGAAAFSLYACTEAALLLKLQDKKFLRFFKKRAHYLAREGFSESGVLSNHRALIVLGLYNTFLVTGEEEFKKKAEERRDLLLKLQTGEGWFPEYEGCDPGYLMFAIDFLAKYYQKSKDSRVVEPLCRAIDFASHFLHPDGSYGGEYGSRNTFHFLPHGLELMASAAPRALWMANRFLRYLPREGRSSLEDDRLVCHYAYNFLQAYADFASRNGEIREVPREDGTRLFKEAGLFVKTSGEDHAVISLAKGGVMKVFKQGRLVYNDAGLAGETTRGIRFYSSNQGNWQYEVKEDKITVEGYCSEYTPRHFSPIPFALFRLFMSFIGRFLPANVVRRWLQKKTILQSKRFPLRFRKEIVLPQFGKITFHLFFEKPAWKIKELFVASDATFIYTATSQPYQKGCLKSWIDFASALPSLNRVGHSIFHHSAE